MSGQMVWSRGVLLLGCCVLLAGCSLAESPSSAPSTIAVPATASGPTPSATTGVQPFWQGPVSFANGSGAPVLTRVRLYPLQRIGSRVLLTVDLTVQSGSGKASLHPFCTGDGCWDLSGISLIDTAGLIRLGPSQAGTEGGPMMTSSTRGPGLATGMTYRFGAVFADPGASEVAVDLQQAGVVPDVPIEDGQLPAANLISTVGPTPSWHPVPVTVGSLVTAPLPALTGTFFDNSHGLVAPVAGAAVSATPGIVTLSADALFGAGSVTPSRPAAALLARVAKALAGRVDPGRPLLVVGYTDASGDAATGVALSRLQADAVAAVLRPRLEKLQIMTAGRGQDDPIAANTTSSGQASPAGRALNRRVVIVYAAKAPGVSGMGTPGPAATTTSSPSASATPDQDALPALVRLGPSVVRSGGRGAKLSAGISAVQVDGALSLVTLELRSDRRSTPAAAFSTTPASPAASAGATGSPGSTSSDGQAAATSPSGVGAFHLIDPRTRQVYVPARDADDATRVTGVFTHRMDARVSYTYSFLTAALPPDLTTVDVSLGDLGIARGVQVRR